MVEIARSATHLVDDSIDAIEYCFRQGWTDGLPVVPPVRRLVDAMIEYGGRAPDEVLGVVPERRRTVTVEKVAANAVMAGCLPLYFPVVLAAVEAMLDPDFSLIGPSSSTAGAATLCIVHGPIARELGLNAGDNLFGPGNRANATIGRALRLVLMNCCGAVPGLFDRSCFGHSGKYTYCIAEDEANSPWVPLHQERGIPAEVSAVTVFAAEAPNQVDSRASADPEAIISALVNRLVASATFFEDRRRPQIALIVGPENRTDLARQGWDKERIRAEIHRRARARAVDLQRQGRLRGSADRDPERLVPALDSPDDLLVIAAGGQAGRYSMVIPGWAGGDSRAVTRPVGVCLQC